MPRPRNRRPPSRERGSYPSLKNSEANPLDPGLRSERKWAIEWLIRVPDTHVTLCPSILGDYFKYKCADEITAQLILAEARFSIENPDKANDQTAWYVAAAQSAIKAYGALRENDPKRRPKSSMTPLRNRVKGSCMSSSPIERARTAGTNREGMDARPIQTSTR